MNKDDIKTDIAVIGGGASGLCSAISAKISNRNIDVTILEKLQRTGKKLLSTGNGKCNLGNKNISENFFHGSIKNYMDIINNTPDIEDFFYSLGVLCRTDDEGRMYPYSNSSTTVLNALRIKISQLGISEVCGFDVKSIEKTKNGFVIKSDERKVYAKRIIVSSGGFSSPVMGTDGAVMEIMKNLGHKITEVYPSLSSLPYKNPTEYKSLTGIRAKGKVTAMADKKELESEVGEIQFSEKAISGICIFNLSYLGSFYRDNFKIKIDFMPEKSYQEILDFLFFVKSIRSDCMLEEYLTGIFPKNLGIYIMKKAVGKSFSDGRKISGMMRRVSSLTSNEIKFIAGMIKSAQIEVLPASSWKNSQVTAGGISGGSVDYDLQSKILKGLYFSGEILDIDGKCGGYNLMWAWSSGLWSGKKCAESLEIRNDKIK